jgi:hypothetical protein
MSSHATLRREIDQWVESSAPAAPWLEQRVMGAVRVHAETGTRVGRGQRRGRGALERFGSGRSFAAGLVAVLLAICTVAALLLSTRALHNLTVPGGRPTPIPTPTPSSIVPFTPSSAVPASNWPPGSPVPAQLAGAWQPSQSAQTCRVTAGNCTLYLGAYTFQIGNENLDPGAANGGTIGPPLYGNVVVNGSEIDFMTDTCTSSGDFGFERFSYALEGNTLVLTRLSGPSCFGIVSPGPWPTFAGTYLKTISP